MDESFNHIIIQMGKPQHWPHFTAITVSWAKTFTQTCTNTVKLLYRCLWVTTASSPACIHTSHCKYASYQEGKHRQGSVNKISMLSLSTNKSGLLCTPALLPIHRDETMDKDYTSSRIAAVVFPSRSMYLHACTFNVGRICLHRMSFFIFRQ